MDYQFLVSSPESIPHVAARRFALPGPFLASLPEAFDNFLSAVLCDCFSYLANQHVTAVARVIRRHIRDEHLDTPLVEFPKEVLGNPYIS